MIQTDPIADFLTRIRNAQKARHSTVDVGTSQMKERLAEILKREGFISRFQMVPAKPRRILRMTLRYHPTGEPMIQEVHRVSKPGCRVYATAKELGGRKNLIETTILTTSKGIMTHQEACQANLGGELICSIM